MPSGITQSIGINASTITSERTAEAISSPKTTNVDPHQTDNQIQISAQAASFSFALKERSKVSPSTEKRVEAPYNPTKDKRKPGKNARVEEKEENSEKEAGVDILA